MEAVLPTLPLYMEISHKNESFELFDWIEAGYCPMRLEFKGKEKRITRASN